jgi:hypothetical protein
MSSRLRINLLDAGGRQQVRNGALSAVQLRNLIESRDKSEIVLRPNRYVTVELPLDRPPHSSETGRCLLAEKLHRLRDVLGRYIRQFFYQTGISVRQQRSESLTREVWSRVAQGWKLERGLERGAGAGAIGLTRAYTAELAGVQARAP